jgi:hypothetical protein
MKRHSSFIWLFLIVFLWLATVPGCGDYQPPGPHEHVWIQSSSGKTRCKICGIYQDQVPVGSGSGNSK